MDDDRSARSEAERVFAEFLEDEELDFESLRAEHSELSSELERLYEQYQQFREHASHVAENFDGDSGGSFFRPRGTRPGGGESSGSPGHSLQPGAVIDDFRLVRILGQGGMGQVWEARQLSLERKVAFKVLPPGQVSRRSVKFFAREGRAVGRLDHPGIASVFAAGEDDGLHWIAMELVTDGWTLRDFIEEIRERTELPADYHRHIAELVAQLAEALQHAHDQGVIHRDLKPQNVLITEGDRPKVTDFGLARLSAEQPLSRTGELSGTCHYMSPEQVTAERIRIDHRTDIFSLGVVLYELLAGRRPFEGETVHQVAERIVTWDPPKLQEVSGEIPGALSAICARAMEKRRDRRYQAMSELAADLRRYLGDEPVVASSAPEASGEGPQARGSRAGWLVAVAAVILLAIGIAALVRPGEFWGDRALDVRADLLLTRLGVRSVLLTDGDTVKEQDRIHLEVAAETELYVYVFNEDNAGNLINLFPLTRLDQNNPIQCEGPQHLPMKIDDEVQYWIVDRKGGGVEHFLIMAGRDPIPEGEMLCAELRQSGDTEGLNYEDLSTEVRSRLSRGVGGIGGISSIPGAEPLPPAKRLSEVFERLEPNARGSKIFLRRLTLSHPD